MSSTHHIYSPLPPCYQFFAHYVYHQLICFSYHCEQWSAGKVASPPCQPLCQMWPQSWSGRLLICSTQRSLPSRAGVNNMWPASKSGQNIWQYPYSLHSLCDLPTWYLQVDQYSQCRAGSLNLHPTSDWPQRPDVPGLAFNLVMQQHRANFMPCVIFIPCRFFASKPPAAVHQESFFAILRWTIQQLL